MRSTMSSLPHTKTPGILQLLNPLTMIMGLWKQRELIVRFTQRDIAARYQGAALGTVWTIVLPILQLSMYTFVFGVILQTRHSLASGTTEQSLAAYAISLFCGLVVLGILNEPVGRAPLMIVNVPSFVKKVVFPLEILPVSTLLASLFQATINFAVILTGHLLTGGKLSWYALLLPIVLTPAVLFSLGLSWFLASLGVFFRDINNIVGLILQMLLFLTPIFYPREVVPASLQPLIDLSPLTVVVENTRYILLLGQAPDWSKLAITTISHGFICVLGYVWFMKTRKAFADVL